MNYVISDIHGCYDKYLELLEKIQFTENDILYVLGDVVDRGDNPIRVLQDIMSRPNVIFIQGNHEITFTYFVSELGLDLTTVNATDDVRVDYYFWLREGGIPTSDGFYELPIEERQDMIEYIENAPLFEELELNGITYVLAHAGIQNYKPNKDMSEYTEDDLLVGRTDYSQPIFEEKNKILVTGHTPTFYFRPDRKAEVFIENGHIAVDCGAVYGGKLAAYCFETQQTFYV